MPSLDGCLAKLARASKHFDDFKVEVQWIEDTIRSAGGRVALRAIYEPHRHRFRAEVDEAPAITNRIGILGGEIIYHLRSALDYLAYELVALENGGVYCQDTQFPISDDAERFNGRRASKANKRTLALLPTRIADIERHQPYGPADEIRRVYDDPRMVLSRVFELRTANRQLGVLRDLANMDKHRLLIEGVALPDSAALQYIAKRDCRDPFLSLYYGAALVKGAFVALINVTPTGPNPEMDVYCSIDPQVGIPFGPAVPTLEAIFAKVIQVIREFEPAF